MKMECHIDPLVKFPGTPEEVFNACGYIPIWLFNSDDVDIPTMELLNMRYVYGMYPLEGATIHDDGQFDYPGDPPAWPLVKMIRGDDIIFQYPAGMVAIKIKDEPWFVTRMD